MHIFFFGTSSSYIARGVKLQVTSDKWWIYDIYTSVFKLHLEDKKCTRREYFRFSFFIFYVHFRSVRSFFFSHYIVCCIKKYIKYFSCYIDLGPPLVQESNNHIVSNVGRLGDRHIQPQVTNSQPKNPPGNFILRSARDEHNVVEMGNTDGGTCG